MKREIITISENGIVTIPTAQILMRDFEIAKLFGVFSQTVKSAIKSILKSGIITPDYTHGGVVIGNSEGVQKVFGTLDLFVSLLETESKYPILRGMFLLFGQPHDNRHRIPHPITTGTTISGISTETTMHSRQTDYRTCIHTSLQR